MKRNQRQVSVRGMVICMLVIVIAIALKLAYTVNAKWYWMLAVTIPILAIVIWREKKWKSGFYYQSNNSYAKNRKQAAAGKRGL